MPCPGSAYTQRGAWAASRRALKSFELYSKLIICHALTWKT